MQDLIEDGLERKTMAVKFWKESSKMAVQGELGSHVEPVTRDTLADWLGTYPITNEETHYAVIMDAKDGKVVWAERYLEPLECNFSEETASEVLEAPVGLAI